MVSIGRLAPADEARLHRGDTLTRALRRSEVGTDQATHEDRLPCWYQQAGEMTRLYCLRIC
jgi:hypothetical protein